MNKLLGPLASHRRETLCHDAWDAATYWLGRKPERKPQGESDRRIIMIHMTDWILDNGTPEDLRLFPKGVGAYVDVLVTERIYEED